MKRFFVLLVSMFLVTGCAGEMPSDGADEGDENVAQRQSQLTGSGVNHEQIELDDGKYSAVVDVGGCTGTIIAPYTVLTASHCEGIQGVNSHVDNTFVNWVTDPSESSHNPYANVTVDATGSTPSVIPYAPSWWRTLNDIRIIVEEDPRLDDWPAQHDQRIVHVPSLTAETIAQAWIDYGGFRPAIIDAYPSFSVDEQIQVSSNNAPTNSDRDYVGVSYVASVPNTITTDPRDGYLRIREWFNGLGQVQGGDSGGPTLGEHHFNYGGSSVVASKQVILGVMHNSGGDTAPLSTAADVALTTNQQYTIRLNQLWVDSMKHDSDRDLIPAECDSDRTTTDPQLSHGNQNECPEPLGSTVDNAPRGGLICPDGFVATGLRGFAGNELYELAVQCTPAGPLLNDDVTSIGAYWTNHFAGDESNGSYFERTCSNGEALFGAFAWHDSSAEAVYGLQPYCRDVSDFVYEGSASAATLGVVGSSNQGTFSSQQCSDGPIRGFDVQSTDTGYSTLASVTGIQTVCAKDFAYTDWVGSDNGSHRALNCPESMVTVGTWSGMSDAYPEQLGPFGLVCQPREDVSSAVAPNAGNTVVVHGSWYDGASSSEHPDGTTQTLELFLQNHAASDQLDLCDDGDYVGGIWFYGPGASGNPDDIGGIYALACLDYSTGSFEAIKTVDVGDGPTSYLACDSGSEVVDELAVNSGWVVDGLALGCSPR